MQRLDYHKDWHQLHPLTALWTVGVLLGNPIYNIVAYFVCVNNGWYQTMSTNVIRVDLLPYVSVLMVLFALRFAYHRHWMKDRVKMNIWFNLEVFLQRKAFQGFGLLTFALWVNDVEGNIAGFIYFPISIFMAAILWLVSYRRLATMENYINDHF